MRRAGVAFAALLALAVSAAGGLPELEGRRLLGLSGGELPGHVQAALDGVADAPPMVEGDLHNLEHVANVPFADLAPAIDADPGKTATFLTLYTHGGRDYAVVGGDLMGAVIVDVTDPERPRRVTHIPCHFNQSDVRVQQVGDRLVLGLGADSGSRPCVDRSLWHGTTERITFWDITDPEQPVALSAAGFTGEPSHTIEFHPTEPLAYVVSASSPTIEIIDFSDPTTPTLAGQVDAASLNHAVRFNADGSRLWSAGSFTPTLAGFDTSDPRSPTPVAFGVAPPGYTYTHEAKPSPDSSLLFLVDESLPGYFSGQCPGGGFAIYDLTVENAPMLLSYTVANTTASTDGACTAHYGDFSPNAEVYATGWYRAGVRVFDVSDPVLPVEIGHAVLPDTSVWQVTFLRDGYLLASDSGRGLDVYRWTGDQPLGS